MYLDWVNERRAMVDKLSDGKIGYMHIPNTSYDGNRELHRECMHTTIKRL